MPTMESAAILSAGPSSYVRCCLTASSSSGSSSSSSPSSHVATSSRLVIPPSRDTRWRSRSRSTSAQTQLKLVTVLENGSNFASPRRLEFSRLQHMRVEAVSGQKKPSISTNETVIPEPSYRIPIVLLGAAGAFLYSDNYFAAVPFGLLGLLLLVQATRVKFIFSKDALEVKLGDELKDSGENVFVGGKNFWKFSTFTNWELWWPNFPILVYFKETQTKPEGQIHFFPLLFDGKKVYDLMVQRAGPSKTSGPK